MSNILSVLNFESQEIRLCGSAENPEWVAVDVGAVLELDHRTVSRRLSNMPENWKGTHSMSTLGGQQQMLTVTEPGLYELIFRSDKPAAQRFRVWVFEEVLPSIRQMGSYSTTPQPFSTQAELTTIREQLRLEILKEQNRTQELKLEQLRERNRGLAITIENKKLGRPQPYQPLPDSPEWKQQLYEAVLAIAQKNGSLTATQAKKYIWKLRKVSPEKIRQLFAELEQADHAELEKTGCKLRLIAKPTQPVDS
jgi:prophage antirepressor-like protein